MSEQTAPGPMAGFHHITAISGDPQRNLDFYQGVLGQRFVKKTVNFDDPGTYHLYYADYGGSPGTVITFFPWARAQPGIKGSGEAVAVAYAAPLEALDGWEARLRQSGARVGVRGERFGTPFLPVQDPDGMVIEIVGVADLPAIAAWSAGPVAAEMELRGFHSTTLQVRDAEASAVLLREHFGWSEVGREGNRIRYQAPAVGSGQQTPVPGRTVDLLEVPNLPTGRMGTGTIHHVAFRTPNDASQAAWREQLVADGFGVTPKRDRQYFHSIYFNEPGGVLYEIATDTPGFAWDEALESLGSSLKLPPWLEPQRGRIEGLLL
ncbi:MAG: ring-cleaving dioxygenase, partial [Caldilineaceae bacterium]